jgi:hypothetical protein
VAMAQHATVRSEPARSQPPYPVELSTERGYAEVRGPEGPRDFRKQVALWTRAVACSASRDVLVVDALRGAPQLHEVHTLVRDFIVPGWGRPHRLAWVLLYPAAGQRFSTAEIWTRMEGINGRAFFSEAAAREWLEEAAAG